MGFPGYFLIVSDFMKWTRGAGHSGRRARFGRLLAGGLGAGHHQSGSACASACSSSASSIPERLSMPDFDIDFCQERRDEVVRYVRDKYGADRVAQIMALGLASGARGRCATRARCCRCRWAWWTASPDDPQSAGQIHFPDGGGGERTAPAADRRVGAHCPAACSRSPNEIEGLYRHASTHPAGVVIGDRPLRRRSCRSIAIRVPTCR